MKSLVVLDQVDSTQDEIIRRLKAGTPVDAVMAYEQTAGRGRFGKTWFSPKDSCLALSLVWHEAIDWPKPELLALAAGLLAAEVFDVSIAWPNDLMVGEKKVGGVLSEVVSCGLGRVPVIGLGVNLSMSAPLDGVPWASSMLLEGRPPMLPLDAATAILDAATKSEPPTSFEQIHERWMARDKTPGKAFKTPEGREGTALAVNTDGSLLLDVDGEEVTVTSAEALYGSGS